MGMEVCRGTVSKLAKPEENGRMECNVGESRVQLHPDLERNIADGDEIIVAGMPTESGIAAMALNNISKKKVSDIDCSNLVLGMGFGGFVGFTCFVLAAQYALAGDITLSSVNALISLAGFALVGWAISKTSVTRKALNKVRYVD